MGDRGCADAADATVSGVEFYVRRIDTNSAQEFGSKFWELSTSNEKLDLA